MRSEYCKEIINKLVKDELEDKYFPLIFIGYPSYQLRKAINTSLINTVENIEEVRDLIEKYYNSMEEDVVYIQDISRIEYKAQDVLLKFLEESRLKIVLISSFDRIRPTIISRMKICLKSYFTPITSNFKSLREYSMVELENTEHKKVEILRDFPMVSYLKSRFGNLNPKLFNKVINVLD